MQLPPVHSALCNQRQHLAVDITLVRIQLELQCHELNSEKQESYVENVKLKMTNEELSRALETTSQELVLAQEQLNMLQEQATRLHQEKEMWENACTVFIYV